MEYSKHIKKFLERYPAAQLQDIFKFFYQAVLGPGHLIATYEISLAELEGECKELSFHSSMINEPLTEELGNDTLRVNLRPYMYKKYDLSILAKAFYDSQFTYKATPQDLLEILEQEKENIASLFNRYQEGEYNSLLIALKEFSFKPFSHSLTYRTNYHPHYRVVRKELFFNLLNEMEKTEIEK